MKRASFLVCTVASFVVVAAGGVLFARRNRYRTCMGGGCANHRRRSLHAGYTLADLR